MAQVIGEIFTKDEADKKYGNVVKSIQLDVAVLKSLMAKTQDSIMFNIRDDEVIILGDGRKALYPAGAVVGNNEVFNRYSVSKVVELLNGGTGATVEIEERDEVLSITYGQNTLEFSAPCPPLC
ncbi:MAG: hypothetical protein V1720_05790 [bacterium]